MFIEPRVELIMEQDLFKRIEIAARTCYNSEGKICEGSAEKMVNALIKRGHMSPLEHSNIVVEVDEKTGSSIELLCSVYTEETALPHFIRRSIGTLGYILSGNLRAWMALDKWSHEYFSSLAKDIPIIETPIKVSLRCYFSNGRPVINKVHINPLMLPFDEDVNARHTIVTARFICDRAVSHELVRHRCLSFSQQSQRYVNYKEGITCVQPHWWNNAPGEHNEFEILSDIAADHYAALIERGYPPQDARAVLPNMTQTEIVATGTQEQWIKYVLPLRLSKAAHPDIRRMMTMLCQQLGWDPNIFV